MKKQKTKRNFGVGFASFVEKAGNKLPNPFWLFWYMAIIILVLSFILAAFNVGFTTIVDGKEVKNNVVNMLSPDEVRTTLLNFFKNISKYDITWIIIITFLGVQFAEKVGLFNTTIVRGCGKIPQACVTPILIFICIISSVATDVGYLFLIPLGGMIYKSLGKHPIAGIACAFAGVSAGFSANLVIGGVDVIVSSLSQPFVDVVDPNYKLYPTMHWYFLIGSTFFLTLIGWAVTTWIIEPLVDRLYPRDMLLTEMSEVKNYATTPLTAIEKRALLFTLINVSLFFIAVVLMALIPGAPLYPFTNEKNQQITPVLESISILIALLFLIAGITYGIVTKVLVNKDQASQILIQIMKEQAVFILVLIGAYTYLDIFARSRISDLISHGVAVGLKASNLINYPLVYISLFIVVVAFLNLFSSGLTGKLLILGPIFVPVFMRSGLSPELTLLAYRIGDSTTNIITPFLIYLPLIIGFAQEHLKTEYKKDFKIGSMISIMFPYSMIFLVCWLLFFIGWFALQIPMGPDSLVSYEAASSLTTTNELVMNQFNVHLNIKYSLLNNIQTIYR